MMLKQIGHKLSRLGCIIQQPSLLSFYIRGYKVSLVEKLNKPWFLGAGIRTVIDIGASYGEFSQIVRKLLPEAHIYAFEPLPDCFERLQHNMRNAPNFRAFNMALDDKQGRSVIYRSEWSPSSSLRQMTSLHKESFPHTAKESSETIEVRRLDDFQDELALEEHILIKLDVQGYEDKVITGGQRLLRRAKMVIVETSMQVLYEGQPLFDDIFMLLHDLGFRFQGMLKQTRNPSDDSVLYTDSIFMRGLSS